MEAHAEPSTVVGDHQVAPGASETPDAFLLYNSKQPEIDEFVTALRQRQLDVWYSRDSLSAGDNWDKRETRVLEAAHAAIIVIGSAGWGTYQLQYAETAQRSKKPIIPVLLGTVNPDTLAELGGLFHNLKRVHLEAPSDPKGLAEIAAAVRKIIERGESRSVPFGFEGLADVDPAPIMSKLVSGDPDDRAEMLDELAELQASYRCDPLWQTILARLPDYRPRDHDDSGAPIRATLLRALPALVATLDAPQPSPPEVYNVLVAGLSAHSEPNEEVRWSTLAGFAAAKRDFPWARAEKDSAHIDAIGYSWAAQSDPSLHDTIRKSLAADRLAATPFTRALTVVAIPALTPELVQRLLTDGDVLTLLALTHDELSAALAAEMADARSLERFLVAACPIVAAGGRHLAGRVSRMLARLPRDHVLLTLRALAAGSTGSTGADRLLALLADPNRQFVAGYLADGGRPPDDLQVGVEVQTLCAVILAKKVEPPLSIGLFGDWGTGKSYFMDAMWEKLESMAADAKLDRQEADFHTSVAQIRFNAWHYIDANLWASLVSHIIEELTLALTPKETDPSVARKALVTELETAKQIKQDAANEQARAQVARSDAEQILGAAAQARAEKQVALGDLRAKDLWAEISKDPELEKALNSTAEGLGLPQTVANVQELEAAVTEAHSLAGRARALLVELPKSTSKATVIALMLILVAGVPAILWVLNQGFLKDKPFATTLSAVFAQVAAIAATLTHAFRAALQKANQGLATLTRAKTRALALLAKERERRSESEVALEKEVNELRAKEQNAAQQLSIAESRVQELANRIRELDEGRSFSKYLLERLQADDYRRHLGIVSTIRRDFGQLEKLLGRAAESTQTEPIQRIVLYVDDLDRCPEDRVCRQRPLSDPDPADPPVTSDPAVGAAAEYAIADVERWAQVVLCTFGADRDSHSPVEGWSR